MNLILPSAVNDPRATAVAATTTPTGKTSGTGEGTPSSASTQQFSTSDFMRLLVTEMKNQDPTQPTDPTQYVQQLVGVNSLQQLIQINEGINGVSTRTTTQS